MNKSNTDYITVGKIGSSYGVRGWLKIQSFTEPGASILDYAPWYISNKRDQWEILNIEDARLQNNDVLAKLVGINTPEKAKLLTGKEIAITREQLPTLKENEYYWSDLIGLTVINKQGEVYGTVSYIMPTGSNDVLIVKGDKEHAIPYLIGDVILKVDLANKEIHVDWELI